MVLEAYQKHQLPSNELYQVSFIFYRCKYLKKQQNKIPINKINSTEMQVTRLFFPI